MSSVLRGPVQPPNTRTQTSHGLTIHANGIIIGTVNQWAPDQSLAITPVFEFGSVTGPFGNLYGTPYEQVPGNVSGMQIRVQRFDIYTAQMEEAFGTRDLVMLTADPGQTDVTGQLTLREEWRTPNNENDYNIIYDGCWFSNIGRTFQTTDNRIVNVNATIMYTSKRRELQG